MHYKLAKGVHYGIIVSTFKQEMSVEGSLIIESDYPYSIKEIPPEGHLMKKSLIEGSWDQSSAGGCGNFGMYHKNPAYSFMI